MTPMSETQPTPGQVIGEDDVAKMRAGDVLRCVKGEDRFDPKIAEGTVVAFIRPSASGGVSQCIVTSAEPSFGFRPNRFIFIGRPGPDGFIPWTGGENPAPGQMVELRWSSTDITATVESEAADWSFPRLWRFVSPPAGSPPSSKTEHVAGDAVSGAVERLQTDVLTILGFSPNIAPVYSSPTKRYINDLAADLRTILASHEAQAAEIADLKARNKALEEDAGRFRALMRCGRIQMQGSSGVDPHTGERNGNNVHFGAEFWPEPIKPEWEATYRESTTWGRACLRALADAILEEEARTLTEADHGR